ncbi:MAG: hypothetical protein AB7T06_39215 [Kofleriaceae bacterium]
MDLTAWSRRRIDGAVLLASPDRDVHACIAPQLRPVRSLGAWLVELAATIPDLAAVRSADDIHELVTDAGEYAQRVSLVTANRRWALGMIIGEHEVVAIHASGAKSDPAGIVDDLLRRHVTPWANERVRMYRYAPPRGWFGAREPWATVWYNAARARIVACDAVPLRSPAIRTRDLLWPAPKKHDEGIVAMTTELSVGAFSIQIQLHEGAPADLDAMRGIVETIEPLPEPMHAKAAVLDWMVA